MPKLIFRSNYFKNEPAVHRSNYIKYLGTREGVEMNPDTMPRFLLSTKANTLREDAHTHAVEDFANASMRGAGTPQAEVPFYKDKDMHGKKENYIDYISGRPRVVLNEGEQHGLFSYPGMRINLEQVMDEVANHKGTVWINVISMKREDAHRLGYENIDTWRNLMWRHVNDLAENFSIDPNNLRWYAAFHNESHHPHVHLVVYSEDEREGFLRRRGLKNLKSKFANDIFGDELGMLYSVKSKQRDMVKEQAKQSLLLSLQRLGNASTQNADMQRMIMQLGYRLKNIKGKKVYGYLHKDVKREIDRIVDELAKIPEVKDCYEKWMDYQKVINGYYYDEKNLDSSESHNRYIPLSWNKEFKSIKNMIISEALKYSKLYQKSESDVSIDHRNQHFLINSSESPEISISQSAANLTKHLEKIFNKLIGDAKSNQQSMSDSKSISKDKEKKLALGHKEDDHESEENKKYISM